MGFLIGTDEAGYGPNLGPLVISASVWWVPDEAGDDLYQLLHKVVAKELPRKSSGHARRVVMADSKKLYNPAIGLHLLERGVLAALALTEQRPSTWQEMWQCVCPEAGEALRQAPWYLDYDCPLPLAADAEDVARISCKLAAGLTAAEVRLLAIRSRAIFPDHWNELLEEHGSKGLALSHLTFELVARVVAELGDGPVGVICDKHGGRNQYGALLQCHLTEWLVEVHREHSEESIYRWGPPERRLEVAFRPRAERYLPAALASMASKYLRELSMRPFNEYWRRHVPELRPTAGYPQDAKRFKREIGAAQTALGIADHQLWRVR
jgi:hypothetical protein